jgi:hypothetical protein
MDNTLRAFTDYQRGIMYTDVYDDDAGVFEYRSAILPVKLLNKYLDLVDFYYPLNPMRALHSRIVSKELLTEPDWRTFGLEMSPGWEHYGTYKGKELMFRRPKRK